MKEAGLKEMRFDFDYEGTKVLVNFMDYTTCKITEKLKKAVFFDRDGVLNHLIERDGSFYSPQKFEDFTYY